MTVSISLGQGRDVSLGFEEVLERTERALEAEGFGVLCRIDVKATLKAKLDVDVPPYTILGACNPQLAHQALTAEPAVGLMLPCNVVLRQVGAGRNRVEVVNARAMATMFPRSGLGSVAEQVLERLLRVLDRVASPEEAPGD
jgi:uncharacterized protein (DUF302 family)